MPDTATHSVTQWYNRNPQLMAAEIEAMRQFFPSAQYGFLPDGRMFWPIKTDIDVAGIPASWTLLVVYDCDHPQRRWGGAVRVYLVKPSYEELAARVQESGIEPRFIPHTLHDDEDQVYLSLDANLSILETHCGVDEYSAAGFLLRALRWAYHFEYGLRDQDIWREFQTHRCRC